MKLSTRMRYGTRALVELASTATDSPVSIKRLAESQSLSVKYLEQIMSSLRHGGLVTSTAGVHGGYLLARPASELSMLDIYLALEGSLCLVDCIDDCDACDQTPTCPTRSLWTHLQAGLQQQLASITLQDVIDGLPGI